MRTSSSFCLSTYLLITSIRAINAITLKQWQPITGFSQACVNAYNTPLTGCTASDFEQGSCSTTCISFLEALTKILNAECGGTSAYPNTLIGAFFEDDGTSILCPNVLGSSGDNNYVFTTGVGEASTYKYTLDLYTSTSATAPSSLTTSTVPLLSAAPTSSTSLIATTTSSAPIAATTTQVAIVNTTVAPNTLTPSASPSSTSHPHGQGSSTSTSSTSTVTSNGDGNGGGSPLDVASSSSANHSSRRGVGVIGLVLGSVGLMLAL